MAVTKDPNWYKAKNKVSHKGIAPANYVQKPEGVKAEAWNSASPPASTARPRGAGGAAAVPTRQAVLVRETTG